MSDADFEFDEIGNWSEIKLEIVEKYGSAYTTAFKNTRLKKYYIDAMATTVASTLMVPMPTVARIGPWVPPKPTSAKIVGA